MNSFNFTHACKSAALVGAASWLLSGCVTSNETSSYDSDGQSAYMTSELDQMGQVYTSAGAAKTSSQESTVTGELIIKPYAFQADCECFVRQAKFTTSEGFERLRIDSVTFLDSNGATLSSFQPALVAKVIHSRNVTKTKGDREADIRFDITAEIKTQDGVKVGVWNGTMTGNYNGQPLKSGSIVNLTRVWENGRFHFPLSGSIELDRPVFHFEAEFLGNDQATFTITNKLNHKVHIIFVDKNYHESEPKEVL